MKKANNKLWQDQHPCMIYKQYDVIRVRLSPSHCQKSPPAGGVRLVIVFNLLSHFLPYRYGS